ncbi:unnamed protein product [Cladocopium goreaui]|uniref:Uncharacterized protein n=1 Tax=Cladocopium goreaui TaxID=2562237 RepID=A0A9P1G1B3_9DINO|nr:unnamed protein product [Cladocopium goreaui]
MGSKTSLFFCHDDQKYAGETAEMRDGPLRTCEYLKSQLEKYMTGTVQYVSFPKSNIRDLDWLADALKNAEHNTVIFFYIGHGGTVGPCQGFRLQSGEVVKAQELCDKVIFERWLYMVLDCCGSPGQKCSAWQPPIKVDHSNPGRGCLFGPKEGQPLAMVKIWQLTDAATGDGLRSVFSFYIAEEARSRREAGVWPADKNHECLLECIKAGMNRANATFQTLGLPSRVEFLTLRG